MAEETLPDDHHALIAEKALDEERPGMGEARKRPCSLRSDVYDTLNTSDSLPTDSTVSLDKESLTTLQRSTATSTSDDEEIVDEECSDDSSSSEGFGSLEVDELFAPSRKSSKAPPPKPRYSGKKLSLEQS